MLVTNFMSKSRYGHSASEFSLGVQHFIVVLSSMAESIKLSNTTFQHHVAVLLYCTRTFQNVRLRYVQFVK